MTCKYNLIAGTILATLWFSFGIMMSLKLDEQFIIQLLMFIGVFVAPVWLGAFLNDSFKTYK